MTATQKIVLNPSRDIPFNKLVLSQANVRRAMSSANSSIETPAFTRRTLDWLSTSLLKGMSREDDRVIL